MKASGIGADRSGIVHDITNFIHSSRGNILRLNSLQVAGDYAVTLIAEFDSDGDLRAAMSGLNASAPVENFRLLASELTSYTPPTQDGTKYVITALGFDRAGIIDSLSKPFSQREINLQSVQADVAAHTPDQGTRMFKSEFVAVLPRGYDTTLLFSEIEIIATDNGLTVHITIVE
jgi:glycine cleavage system regulatory protein